MNRHTPTPLTEQQLNEINETHPGDWYAGEWRSHYVDSTPDELAHYVVKHQESGTVLAELPDWAGPIALFIADAHDVVPALVAEVRRLRATPSMECINCETPVGWVDCPTGGWWAHETHPTDGHDADPRPAAVPAAVETGE